MLKIRQADSGHMPLVRALFREYAGSLHFDLAFQGFERELSSLPGDYGLPRGCLLLAFVGDEAAGCVALRPWEGGTGEIKRLYVRPAFQGRGLGRKLTDELIGIARSLGYEKVRLDTVPSMGAAIAMYRSMGFHEIPAYRENPVPGTLYFEKKI